MISKSINRILLITIVCFSALVSAQQFDNPYQGNIMVGSFTETQLKDLALVQVLIKVSGNSDIATRSDAKALLNKANQYISQYGYRQAQGSKYFYAMFDKNKINKLLKKMEQPVWDVNRPTTLIWLVNNDEIVSDNFIVQSQDAKLTNGFYLAEQQRGIDVQFPLMDLDDNIALSPSDIKGRFYQQVSAASERYELQYFVSAALQELTTDRWNLSWQLLSFNGNTKRTHSVLNKQYVGSKSAVTEKMVNAVADYYASQYAVFENQGKKFKQTIFIDGIISLSQLSELELVMGKMSAISSYSIVAVQSQQITVEVKLKGDLNSFKKALNGQSQLQLNTDPVINESAAGSLIPVSNAALANALYLQWR